jgi:hypothetical protein
MSEVSLYLTIPKPDDVPTEAAIPGGDVKGATYAQHFSEGGNVPLALNFGQQRKLFLLSKCLRLQGGKYVACDKRNLLKHRFSTKPSLQVAMLTDIQFIKALSARDLVGMGLLLYALHRHFDRNGEEFSFNTQTYVNGVASVGQTLAVFVPVKYESAHDLLHAAVSAFSMSPKVYTQLLDGCEELVREAAAKATQRVRISSPQELMHSAYTDLLMLVMRCLMSDQLESMEVANHE